jgi:hypothetical protein
MMDCEAKGAASPVKHCGTIMGRQVYFENWQEQLEEAVADIELRIGPYSSLEQRALLGELEQLKEMARQVRNVEPERRQPVTSVALAWHVKEPLQLSDDMLKRFGELFDIYRRFRTRLTWNE